MKHLYIDLDDTLIPFDSFPRFLPTFLATCGPAGWALLARLPWLARKPRRPEIRPAVARILKGRAVEPVEAWCAGWVSKALLPKVRRHLMPADIPFSLCSMSLDLVVDPLARELGGGSINTSLGRENDVFTGELAGPQCGGAGKRELLLKDCTARDLEPADVGLMTDHHRDIPALEAVGHPVLVNPTRELRSWADAWSRPVEILQT